MLAGLRVSSARMIVDDDRVLPKTAAVTRIGPVALQLYALIGTSCGAPIASQNRRPCGHPIVYVCSMLYVRGRDGKTKGVSRPSCAAHARAFANLYGLTIDGHRSAADE